MKNGIVDPTKESAVCGVCPTCGLNPESVKRSWHRMVQLLEEKEALIKGLESQIADLQEHIRI